MAAGSTSLPFAATPAFMASAFYNQINNASNWAMDALQIDFIETESPLSVKGKITTAFFY